MSLFYQQADRKIPDGDDRPGLIIILPLISDLRMHGHSEVTSGLNAELKAWVLCKTYETKRNNLLLSHILNRKQHKDNKLNAIFHFGLPSSYQVLWVIHDGLMNSSPPIPSFLFHPPAFTCRRLVYK